MSIHCNDINDAESTHRRSTLLRSPLYPEIHSQKIRPE